jgi:hypothetical protein
MLVSVVFVAAPCVWWISISNSLISPRLRATPYRYKHHERTTTDCEKHGNTQISPNLSHKLWKRLAPGMPGRSYQTKAGLPSGCQVNIKCFYAKSTCHGSNYRNISSLTLVQKVIPGYLQRTVDNYSRAYLWLISWSFAWCSSHEGTQKTYYITFAWPELNVMCLYVPVTKTWMACQ